MVQKFDIVIFDLDSTLVSIEGLSWLAKERSQKELPLFHDSLDGKVPLKEAITRELSLLSPTYTDMLMLGRKYQEVLVEDVPTVIEALHILGKKVLLLTNNFHPAIDIIANALHIPLDQVFGTEMIFDQHGKYQGFDTSSLLITNNGKAETIRRTIPKTQRVAFIGDGFLDLEAKPVVDLFIGFGGVVSRPAVKKHAHVFIDSRSLLPILPLLLEKDEIELLEKHYDSSLMERAASTS